VEQRVMDELHKKIRDEILFKKYLALGYTIFICVCFVILAKSSEEVVEDCNPALTVWFMAGIVPYLAVLCF
jgi:hypothetical protein